eukprot:scaffold874_cov380-Prasinococcus_capsulatus_cf.AAC.9
MLLPEFVRYAGTDAVEQYRLAVRLDATGLTFVAGSATPQPYSKALRVELCSARERIHEEAERVLLKELELYVEFSGLLCWGKRGAIGWHHDSVRMTARHYAAVCYLSTAEEHFTGVSGDTVDHASVAGHLSPTRNLRSCVCQGRLQFQKGRPEEVEARQGSLVLYGAGAEHVHRVSPVGSVRRRRRGEADPAAGGPGAALPKQQSASPGWRVVWLCSSRPLAVSAGRAPPALGCCDRRRRAPDVTHAKPWVAAGHAPAWVPLPSSFYDYYVDDERDEADGAAHPAPAAAAASRPSRRRHLLVERSRQLGLHVYAAAGAAQPGLGEGHADLGRGSALQGPAAAGPASCAGALRPGVTEGEDALQRCSVYWEGCLVCEGDCLLASLLRGIQFAYFLVLSARCEGLDMHSEEGRVRAAWSDMSPAARSEALCAFRRFVETRSALVYGPLLLAWRRLGHFHEPGNT